MSNSNLKPLFSTIRSNSKKYRLQRKIMSEIKREIRKKMKKNIPRKEFIFYNIPEIHFIARCNLYGLNELFLKKDFKGLFRRIEEIRIK